MPGVSLVNDGAALQSMRNSDFDAYSAVGEVIDNSIQAQAENIRIEVKYKPPQTTKAQSPITSVAFGDDGIGMSKDVLHRCLQLGYSSRYNDRKGIGRFGVGATLAAINQCKRVEIYSKESGGDWLYTYIDLDMITKQPPEMTQIPDPVKKSVPGEYQKLVGNESGTLVVWSKYDRQQISAPELIDELHVWVGRTYRRFIWQGVNLMINGANVRAIDPLYVTTELTKFPDDPKAYEYQEMKLSWPIPIEDRVTGGPTQSEITIRISLLPKDFRPTQGSGNSNQARDRYIDRNEGISILRNEREVFYGHIPYWPGGSKESFKEIDRWWGCEISFDAVLDSAFMVKNIKRGALPITTLKQSIHDAITPTRHSALEAVREVWTQKDASEHVTDGITGVDTGHADAEKAAKDTVTPKNVIDAGKDLDEETRKLADDFLKDADEQVKAQWHAKFKSQPFTIVDAEWRGPEFVETNHLGGVDVLKYNMRHVFFTEINAIRKALAEDETELPHARRLKALIDLLLISYSKAEAMFDRGAQLTAERFVEQIRMNWGHYLTNYIDTYNQQSKEGEE